MKEPDDEGLASHIGPESCTDARKSGGEALTGVHVGWVLSREIPQCPGCRRREKGRKATSRSTPSRVGRGPCAVEDPVHAWTHLVREPGDPRVALGHPRPHREVSGRTAMTHDPGKSDRFVVPAKSSNNAPERAAEVMEGRERTKGKTPERNALRTQRRGGAPSALERVRQLATRDRSTAVHRALPSRVCRRTPCAPRISPLKRDAAAGVDGETWQHYGADLEARLQDLSERLRRGAYRAQPVRRAYIPKADGRPAAARRSRAGRQNRPARRRRGAERDLRIGLPRVLVRISAAAQPAPRVGCARGRRSQRRR